MLPPQPAWGVERESTTAAFPQVSVLSWLCASLLAGTATGLRASREAWAAGLDGVGSEAESMEVEPLGFADGPVAGLVA